MIDSADELSLPTYDFLNSCEKTLNGKTLQASSNFSPIGYLSATESATLAWTTRLYISCHAEILWENEGWLSKSSSIPKLKISLLPDSSDSGTSLSISFWMTLLLGLSGVVNVLLSRVVAFFEMRVLLATIVDSAPNNYETERK